MQCVSCRRWRGGERRRDRHRSRGICVREREKKRDSVCSCVPVPRTRDARPIARSLARARVSSRENRVRPFRGLRERETALVRSLAPSLSWPVCLRPSFSILLALTLVPSLPPLFLTCNLSLSLSNSLPRATRSLVSRAPRTRRGYVSTASSWRGRSRGDCIRGVRARRRGRSPTASSLLQGA